MRKILNTLRIILSLQNTINVNGILYGFRKIPIIGKYIPEQIYGIRIFKIYASFVSFNYELFKAFFGKLAFFCIVFVCSYMFDKERMDIQPALYLYVFLAASFITTLFFNVFKTSKEAEYAVFHLGMDAKEYIQAVFFKQAFNIFIGYAVFGIPTAIIAKVAWFTAILLPFSGVGFIVLSLGIHMTLYAFRRSLGRRFNKKPTVLSVEGGLLFEIIITMIVFIASIALLALVIEYDIYYLIASIVLVSAFCVIPGILLIRRFPYGLYKTALSEAYDKNEIIKKQSKKENSLHPEVKINETVKSESDAKGYKFLNELFIKRHAKILLTRLIWTIIGVGAAIALASLLLHYELLQTTDYSKSVIRFFAAGHTGVFPFILFCINIGSFMAYAMYTNCDSTFLKYSFYRKPQALRKMYRLRVMSTVKFNLIPALMIAVFAVVAIILTGGEDYFSQCIFTVILCIVSTAFFSMRNITILYLIQPYTDKFKGIKSIVSFILSSITEISCFILLFFKIPAVYLSIAGMIILAVYFFISDKLVYKFAPKTFTIK